jgi:predicted HicB family RNase H-like nuclease
MTTLRFTPEQHARIKAAAERDGRSVNGWLAKAAEEKMARDAATE